MPTTHDVKQQLVHHYEQQSKFNELLGVGLWLWWQGAMRRRTGILMAGCTDITASCALPRATCLPIHPDQPTLLVSMVVCGRTCMAGVTNGTERSGPRDGYLRARE